MLRPLGAGKIHRDSSAKLCGLCSSQTFRYTCPRCGIHYCSIACYKSLQHQKCIEKAQQDPSSSKEITDYEQDKLLRMINRFNSNDDHLNSLDEENQQENWVYQIPLLARAPDTEPSDYKEAHNGTRRSGQTAAKAESNQAYNNFLEEDSDSEQDTNRVLTDREEQELSNLIDSADPELLLLLLSLDQRNGFEELLKSGEYDLES